MREALMHATIRQYTMKRDRAADLLRSIQDEFVTEVSKIPGFISYEAVDAGDRLVTISMFEGKDGSEESTRRAAKFVASHPEFSQGIGPAQVTEGEVKVHKATEKMAGASAR
jgi:hypothetical protein